MANAQALVKATIWDGDFRNCSVAAQHLYLLLITQPEMTLCGVLPLTLGRWAGLSKGATAKSVGKALDELVAARFVLLDPETDEVMVRTYIRYNGTLKNSNLTLGLTRVYDAIRSPALRDMVIASVPRGVLNVITAASRPQVPQSFVDALRNAHPHSPSNTCEDACVDSPSDACVDAYPDNPLNRGPDRDPKASRSLSSSLPLLPNNYPPSNSTVRAPAVVGGGGHSSSKKQVIEGALLVMARQELATERHRPGAIPIRSEAGWLKAKAEKLGLEHRELLTEVAESTEITKPVELLEAVAAFDAKRRERESARNFGRNYGCTAGEEDYIRACYEGELLDIALEAFRESKAIPYKHFKFGDGGYL